ncbi:quinone-dependent dihydroorotate dehydrogenase [Hazenella sp. IB182357]|uniref:Dihydroorotate dehydrogenase (quinone) n=1 Tax=Polycladospora coralii TaxID=2771432 RepID=A0A926NBE5_9BACL|nr:quinone-dependent dihydroorotate dehydrogenase [Polycladospora coralii]MBS7530729.1 quinone-dependent dihydroorotate dehydrogenase [Polycladospora coralii]
MYTTLRKALFSMNPETIHHLTINSLKTLQKTKYIERLYRQKWTVHHEKLSQHTLGLSFLNPVGLAAGFDKHAEVYPALASFGFGFIEVGTLTPRPQAGNPTPRLFRLPADQALINRMGFNNHGVESALRSFASLPRPTAPIGINLGKNKDTPNDLASDDYTYSLKKLYAYGDYFVINISSPNTKGLRDLQHIDALKKLLDTIIHTRAILQDKHRVKKPILLKIAPDLSDEQLQDVIHTSLQIGIDGIIATNTTLARNQLRSSNQTQSGGLSGKPLADPSTDIIRKVYQIIQGRIPIIGVGGIFTGADAYEKFKAGANLIQVYTGMIYHGPAIAKKINMELLTLLEQDSINHIGDIIGSEAGKTK